ncbi:protein FAM156A/FAM156B isoform X5 [Meles meles]|uniref:protein FAM156A/FAM156B isoform X3 n=1 Tax=Meles meles TaxID=9662 RepID=UPI001E69AA05|nr:protein FAM156A/FAM156B isoform X3 [Meles meles]XP_045851872.1 protein FAM156A/FAM156B isoform X5 [Meles meles]
MCFPKRSRVIGTFPEAQSHHLAKLPVLLHVLIQLGVSAQALLTDLQECKGVLRRLRMHAGKGKNKTSRELVYSSSCNLESTPSKGEPSQAQRSWVSSPKYLRLGFGAYRSPGEAAPPGALTSGVRMHLGCSSVSCCRCGITLQSSWLNERNEGVSRCWPVGKEETVCWETLLFIQKIQGWEVSFLHWTLLYLDVGLGTSVPETATSELERTYVLDGITGPQSVPTCTHPSDFVCGTVTCLCAQACLQRGLLTHSTKLTS